jgi:hypothetical protein
MALKYTRRNAGGRGAELKWAAGLTRRTKVRLPEEPEPEPGGSYRRKPTNAIHVKVFFGRLSLTAGREMGASATRTF